MDDLALGQEFQKHGQPVHCYSGKGIAWLRMYPEGLSSMIQGYAKSMAAGSAATHRGIMLLIYMWMAGGLLTPVLLLISMGMDGFAIGIPVGLYLACAIELAIASRRVGQFTDWIFPIYPVLLVVFIATFLYSVYLSKRRKSVQWKGRNIDV